LEEVHDQKLKLKKQSEQISELGRELALAIERVSAKERENQELAIKQSSNQEKYLDDRQEQQMKSAKLEIEKSALELELRTTKEQLKVLKSRIEKGDPSAVTLSTISGIADLELSSEPVTTTSADGDQECEN